MEITAEIDIDQIVDEVVNSTEIERVINDAVAAEIDLDQIVDEVVNSTEIARSTGTAGNADLTDRVAALEARLSTLTEALTSAGKLIEALVNFNANV